MNVFKSKGDRIFLIGLLESDSIYFDFGYFGSYLPETVKVKDEKGQEYKLDIPKKVQNLPTYARVIKARIKICQN